MGRWGDGWMGGWMDSFLFNKSTDGVFFFFEKVGGKGGRRHFWNLSKKSGIEARCWLFEVGEEGCVVVVVVGGEDDGDLDVEAVV